MKKLMLFAALCAFMGVSAALAGDRFSGTLTIAAGGTSATTTVELFRADGPPCTDIDTVFATVASGAGTGTVVFAVSEAGKTETISTSTAMVSGGSFFDRPVTSESVLYTYPVVQNVVTGSVVLATQVLQTNYAVQVKSYLARQLKVTITQGAVANATVYDWSVFTKTDPPPVQK